MKEKTRITLQKNRAELEAVKEYLSLIPNIPENKELRRKIAREKKRLNDRVIVCEKYLSL